MSSVYISTILPLDIGLLNVLRVPKAALPGSVTNVNVSPTKPFNSTVVPSTNKFPLTITLVLQSPVPPTNT